MNKTINFAMFIFGAAVGSIVTWRYIEKKYERIAQDEIDSVKEVFSKRESGFTDDAQTMADNAKEKPNLIEYSTKLREQGYTNYSDIPDEKPRNEVKNKPMDINSPYIITPEEFGDNDDYEIISLTYYDDQILADDNDDLIEDVEYVVGFESLESFGEYEDDSVFVRNDRLKCDYEILLDKRKYSDIVKKKPRKPHEVDD